MKWGKTVTWIVLAGMVGAAGYLGSRWWTKTDPGANTAQAKISTAAAKRGPLRQVVQCTGTVQSNLDVDIKCRASGQIVKLPFDISDSVKKGDLLLELDPVDQERQVQQSQATVAAANARLAQAQAALAVAEKSLEADRQKAAAAVQLAERRVADSGAKAKREQELQAKKFSSAEELETAQTTAVQAEQDLKTAQAQLESIKAQELDLETKRQDIKLFKAQADSSQIALDVAKLQLSYTSIFSPIDGVVAARNVQIGNIISSGISNVGGGTTVLTLSDLSHMYCYASVDESDIGFVQIGQKAEITADSFLRKKFSGTVDRIATKGVSVSNVVTFEVRIELTSENKGLLKPLMTTTVNIIVADKPDVLQVPANAITRRKDGEFVTLKTAEASASDLHPVEIGITNGAQTEIIGGLNEGDEVVLQNPEDESRWKAGGQNPAMQQRMMMRTMGGGAGGGGGRR
ncbi:MAG: efflux RND transporter periplasmic adaptor subunit [Candidatus Hydrogenedentes bacterium]|nr:efflux RND transporter periplasmic adaptor subunit [Candidatus Hydrogenedentota bacterium]